MIWILDFIYIHMDVKTSDTKETTTATKETIYIH